MNDTPTPVTKNEGPATAAAPVIDPRLSGLVLARGPHAEREKGMCAMEAVAYFAGEAHSDMPDCACRVVRRFVISCNDRWSDEERQQLLPLVPILVGSRVPREVEVRRAYHFADFAVRAMLPWLCEKVGKPDLAAKLRQLAKVADRATAELARQEARSARDILRAAAAADAAAAAAAADAADAAAAYAAAAAAAAAAADAAADAAAYAAAYAAYAAAADAASNIRKALRNEMVALCIEAIRQALEIR